MGIPCRHSRPCVRRMELLRRAGRVPRRHRPQPQHRGNSWWESLKKGEYISTSEGPYDLGSSPEGDPTKLRANTPLP